MNETQGKDIAQRDIPLPKPQLRLTEAQLKQQRDEEAHFIALHNAVSVAAMLSDQMKRLPSSGTNDATRNSVEKVLTYLMEQRRAIGEKCEKHVAQSIA